MDEDARADAGIAFPAKPAVLITWIFGRLLGRITGAVGTKVPVDVVAIVRRAGVGVLVDLIGRPALDQLVVVGQPGWLAGAAPVATLGLAQQIPDDPLAVVGTRRVDIDEGEAVVDAISVGVFRCDRFVVGVQRWRLPRAADQLILRADPVPDQVVAVVRTVRVGVDQDIVIVYPVAIGVQRGDQFIAFGDFIRALRIADVAFAGITAQHVPFDDGAVGGARRIGVPVEEVVVSAIAVAILRKIQFEGRGDRRRRLQAAEMQEVRAARLAVDVAPVNHQRRLPVCGTQGDKLHAAPIIYLFSENLIAFGDVHAERVADVVAGHADVVIAVEVSGGEGRSITGGTLSVGIEGYVLQVVVEIGNRYVDTVELQAGVEADLSLHDLLDDR